MHNSAAARSALFNSVEQTWCLRVQLNYIIQKGWANIEKSTRITHNALCMPCVTASESKYYISIPKECRTEAGMCYGAMMKWWYVLGEFSRFLAERYLCVVWIFMLYVCDGAWLITNWSREDCAQRDTYRHPKMLINIKSRACPVARWVICYYYIGDKCGVWPIWQNLASGARKSAAETNCRIPFSSLTRYSTHHTS